MKHKPVKLTPHQQASIDLSNAMEAEVGVYITTYQALLVLQRMDEIEKNRRLHALTEATT